MAAGVLVTLSATAEGVDAAGYSLVIRIHLESQAGAGVDGLIVRAPIPPATRVTDSWLGTPGANPGRLDTGALEWRDFALAESGSLGPFTYRIVPEDGADGARIFLGTSVQPAVTWMLPRAGQASPPELPLNGLWGESGLRRTVLPTLLTVLTRERPESRSVMLRVAVAAGSRDEDDSTSGGSHWLEHAHFLGTSRRPNGAAVTSVIENVGGEQNASTSWEYTNYWNLVPADKFPLAVDLLADMLVHSTFPREAFERERRVVFEELKLRNDNPSVRALDEFMRLIFQSSPLRRDPSGTIESVQRIPIETMLAYRAQRYVTGNIAIAAVGQLAHDDAVALIRDAFAELPRGPRVQRPRVPEPAQTAMRTTEIGEGSRLAEVRLGWPAPGNDSPDWAAMWVIEYLLGDTGERLFEAIINSGLGTYAAPSFYSFSDAGTLMLSARTTPDLVQRVIDALLREINALRSGRVTERQIQACVRAIAGEQALSDEYNYSQSSRADREVEGSLLSSAEQLAMLRNVTVADVVRVAQTYLNTAAYTLVIVRA